MSRRSFPAKEEVPPFCRQAALQSRRMEHPGEDDGPLIHVIHVPKTGGTAMRDTLFKWAYNAKRGTSLGFKTHVYFNACNYQEECSNGSIVRQEHGIFVGHTGFGIRANAPANRLNVIIMREPISRITSFFNYLHFEKRAPADWSNKSLDGIFSDYRRVRLSQPEILNTNQTSLTNRLVHHILTDQLSYLASYKCVAPAPDTNPFNCTRPNRDAGECSVQNMTNMALINLRLADSVIVTSKIDSLIAHLRFHLRFIPKSEKRISKRNVSKVKRFSRINATTKAWLNDWLKDEIELYKVAERINREQTEVASKCAYN